MVNSCNIKGVLVLQFLPFPSDNNKLTMTQEYFLCCNYSPYFKDFSILTRGSNDFKLKIMESLLMMRDKIVLNKAGSSLPSELFWCHICGNHMFYHIVWCPSISLCAYNCRLFNFRNYVASFSISDFCMSI